MGERIMIAAFIDLISVPETQADDQSLSTIVLFCGVGLITSFCLMAFGLDLSAAWI